ncbi:hypothetical protein GCM10023232_23430 [Sphingosinicella ginsenosidimutans]|jgi:hypothetical protein|uniref:Spore coat protein U domain-containing protein n=1 Tax=Allosphingosinicella ginsenosidimutans TaxID=1176539 RepID=A0A5C6TTB4_9SPHN|nr:hypothetical protein [Sphingosinicella ginsenosidimutans]TXC63567.1 hypothetical protein FRZ32_07765 [Sphingosinicella ginsenosidimutans]
MRLSAKLLAAFGLLSLPAAAEAGGASVTFRALVPTICQLRSQLSGTAEATNADLVVFCNAPEGARISAVLTGGDSAGYRITGAGAPLIATSGTEFDVRTYATAYSGQEHLQIAPVSQTPGATPTILFQIVPVG